MTKLTANSISQKYEQLYKSFSEKSTEDECFYAINNAMIFAYFIKHIDIDFNGENEIECCKQIVNKYGTDIFFHNVKKTRKYKANRKIAVEVFTELFSEKTEVHNSLERVLGNVLEKHINRKSTGSYYTPEDTTRYIAWSSILISSINKLSNKTRKKVFKQFRINKIGDLLNNKKKDIEVMSIINSVINDEERKELLKVIYSLKIIDPTCGSGAFVIAAFECLETYIECLGEKVNYSRLLKCLHGVDISKEAIQLTKLRLIMKMADNEYKMKDFELYYSRNFIIADALKGSDYLIKEEGFDWKSFKYKFDCIVGNPPYVEQRGYTSDNFKTKKCGNLYAYTIERACNIAKKDGVISFVVPLPFVSTPRMQVAKQFLENCSEYVYYGTYADRPGCIFTGVHQRLTIFFAIMGEDKCKVYSSKYNYWYNDERSGLFSNIKYISNSFDGVLPKIGNAKEKRIYKKLTSGDSTLKSKWLDQSDFPVYLSTRIGFWTKAFDKNVFSSKEYKTIYARNEEDYYLTLAVLNSSTFYFLWVILSDCWHITDNNIMSLRFNDLNISRLNIEKIKKLIMELMKDLEKNKKYIGSKQTEYEYKHKYSKSIIDGIDRELGKLFELTDEEINYIQSFTEKYRLNKLEA